MKKSKLADSKPSSAVVKAGESSDAPRGFAILVARSASSSWKMPTLQLIYETLLQKVYLSLKNILRAELTIEGYSSHVLRYSEYCVESDDVVSVVLEAPELNGDCFLRIKRGHVYDFIDVMLGGEVVEARSYRSRALTALDMEVLKCLAMSIVESLNDAFAGVAPVIFKIAKLEHDSRALSVFKEEEVISVLSVSLRLGNSNVISVVDLILPHSSIEPIKKILSRKVPDSKLVKDPIWLEHLEKEVRNTTVKLELVLDGSVSKVQEMLNLKVGNTLVLDVLAEDPLEVSINGINVTIGKLGKAGDRVAVQLLEDIDIARSHNLV